MTCGCCRLAERDPRTGHYHADCRECQARALAQSPGYAASVMMRRMREDYAQALREIAGESAKDRDALHQRVKTWAKRIDEARTGAKEGASC
jgi:hypothetical protein